VPTSSAMIACWVARAPGPYALTCLLVHTVTITYSHSHKLMRSSNHITHTSTPSHNHSLALLHTNSLTHETLLVTITHSHSCTHTHWHKLTHEIHQSCCTHNSCFSGAAEWQRQNIYLWRGECNSARRYCCTDSDPEHGRHASRSAQRCCRCRRQLGGVSCFALLCLRAADANNVLYPPPLKAMPVEVLASS
jgi:hypothetical protein